MKTILLIWFLITPDGQPQAIVRVEPTVEQCQIDGAVLKAQSDELVKAGTIQNYYGACHVQELNDAGKDPRGSI